MASTERPVFRQLGLAPTNSLHAKTSSLSEWEAKRSRTGQDPSCLAALCSRARHMLAIPAAVFLPKCGPPPFLCATKMVSARGFALL